MNFPLLCCVLWILCGIVDGAGGKPKREGKKCMTGPPGKKRMQCKGEEANMDVLKPLIDKCGHNGTEGNEETRKLKMKVCMWEAYGVVKKDKFNAMKFEEYIMSMYSATTGEELAKALAVCIIPQNISGLSKDEDCKSYRPLWQCFTKAKAKYCKM